MLTSLKKKVHTLIDPRYGATRWDKIIDGFIICLILLNTLAVMLETIKPLYGAHRSFFHEFDVFSVTVFTVEYILRVWSCTVDPRYQGSIKGRLKYMTSVGAIIDLLAILPFYLPLLASFDLRLLRLLRILRLARVFKLGRYMNASKVMTNVFRSKKEELVLSFIITMFLIVIASSVMYFAEHEAQPAKFASIPETMWWAVATLTTVGYGDTYPITGIGKFLGACISVLGIGIFALPAGILASGFSDELRKIKHKNHCPHCGKELQN